MATSRDVSARTRAVRGVAFASRLYHAVKVPRAAALPADPRRWGGAPGANSAVLSTSARDGCHMRTPGVTTKGPSGLPLSALKAVGLWAWEEQVSHAGPRSQQGWWGGRVTSSSAVVYMGGRGGR